MDVDYHPGWTPTHQAGPRPLLPGRCPQERGQRPVQLRPRAPHRAGYWGGL